MCILSPLPYLLATGPAHAQGWATWGCEHQEARDLGGPAESVHSFSLRSHCISCTLYILYTIVHSFFSQFFNIFFLSFTLGLCVSLKLKWVTVVIIVGSYFLSIQSHCAFWLLNSGCLHFELLLICKELLTKHPTPVLLPGKSHGWRSLEGCNPWGRQESDTTESLHFHFSLSCTGEGNGNPLQCSCLENPRDRGAWWAAVYGVSRSRTRLKQLSSSSSNLSEKRERDRQREEKENRIYC